MRCNVKTCYLYSMTSRLVNVRLDADRLRKVGRLRERGVAMSDLVRQAIDERFEALTSSANNHDVKAVVTRVLEQYPDPVGLPARRYNVHDRTASRDAILHKLRRMPR